jgi:hypothetical protein
MKARARPDGRGDWENLAAVHRGVHDDHNAALTRLRLLASPRIVRAAERLHVDDDRLADLAFARFTVPTTDDEETFRGTRDANRQMKDAFFAAARTDLGLGPAGKIDRQLWGM